MKLLQEAAIIQEIIIIKKFSSQKLGSSRLKVRFISIA